MTAPARPRAALDAAMTEKQLQDCIVQAARTLGYLVFHANTAQGSEPGYPDLTIVGHRRLYVFECKSAKGRLRPATVSSRGRVLPGQWDWLAAFADAGARIGVVRPATLDDVLADLKDGFEEMQR